MAGRGVGLWAALAVATLGVAGCATEVDVTDARFADMADGREAQYDEDDVLDATIDQMIELGNTGTSDRLSEEERACIEDHPKLRDIDFRDVFTDVDAADQRVVLVAVLFECVQQTDLLATSFVNNVDVATGVELSVEEGVCVIEEIKATSDEPARLIVGTGLSEAEMLGFFDTLEICVTPEHFAAMTGEEGAGAQVYGDDERLDSMYDDCGAGEPRACDLLFLQAATGSEYERFAATCGETTSDTTVFCAPESETDDTGFAPADSPGLRILARDCEDGDLTACDLLYQLVPFEHDLEQVGNTCGGRIPVGAIPDCRTRLG